MIHTAGDIGSIDGKCIKDICSILNYLLIV